MNIKGLKHRKQEYKLRAFADDILFIVEDPLNSFYPLLERMREFGALAGSYLNEKKSKIICKNMARDKEKLIQKITNLLVKWYLKLSI